MTLTKTLAAFALASASLTSWAAEPTTCKTVHLADVGWTDVAATTGVATNLFQGLGYQTNKIIGAVPIVFTGLGSGQLDVFLGYWTPTMNPIAQPFIDKGSIDVLETPNLVGAKYTLAVPAYAYDGGLKSFQDIARYADKLGGRIYGIEPGNDGNLAIQKMIDGDQYGLGDFQLIESSEAGMLVTLRRAVAQKQWMVFLGWEPHPMNFKQDIRYLSGGDAVFGPNYGEAKVYTAVAKDWLQTCPNAGRLVQNLKFNTAMENEMMVPIMDGQDADEATRDWMRQHPEQVKTWLAGVKTVDGQDGLAAVQAYLKQD